MMRRSVKVGVMLFGSLALPTACMKSESGTDRCGYMHYKHYIHCWGNNNERTMDRSDNPHEEPKAKENIAKKARPKIVNKPRKNGVVVFPEDGHDVAAMRVVWNERSVSKKKKMLLQKTGKDHLKGLLLLPTVLKKRIESYLAVGLLASDIPKGSLVRFIDEKGKIQKGKWMDRGNRVALPRPSWLPCVIFDGAEPEVDSEKMLSINGQPRKAGPIYGRCMSVLCRASTLDDCCHTVVIAGAASFGGWPPADCTDRIVFGCCWLPFCVIPMCALCVAGCPYTYLRTALCGCANNQYDPFPQVPFPFFKRNGYYVKERCEIPCPCPYPEFVEIRSGNNVHLHVMSECYEPEFHASARCMWPCCIWYPYTENFQRPRNI